MDLRKEFHKDMISIYQKAKKECGYNATRFLQMVAVQDGLTVAKSFIHSQPTDGFTTLWELGRMDLTVEALILQKKYEPLFTAVEREAVRERLQEYGYETVV
jgi:5-methylcytosine-specific restriction enzyme A